jgi:hypothetical protein
MLHAFLMLTQPMFKPLVLAPVFIARRLKPF